MGSNPLGDANNEYQGFQRFAESFFTLKNIYSQHYTQQSWTFSEGILFFLPPKSKSSNSNKKQQSLDNIPSITIDSKIKIVTTNIGETLDNVHQNNNH
jgi:hypothetical protein